ncbi:MAG: O-antigen ligase family protein [Flavobacteriaceae bacterium]
MILSLFTGLLILYICWRKPIAGLAVLVQINLVRAVVSLDFNNLCFKCINESDLLLGAIIPLLGFALILVKLYSKNKNLKFKLSFIDVFFVLVIVTLFYTSIFSANMAASVAYTGRFILLASSYYFISKIIILNAEQPNKLIIDFLKVTLILGVCLGIISLILLYFSSGYVDRLTIPGVHPIPFSQLIGFAVLVIISSLIIDKKLLPINIGSLVSRGLLLVFLLMVLFASNTKGILLSIIISFIIMLYLKGFKISKKLLVLMSLVILPLTFYVVSKIGYESLFERLFRSLGDNSINHRLLSYGESFEIFMRFPLTGSGPGAYDIFGYLPYPHNFFLENIAQYGILGIIINIYFLFMLYIIFEISNRTKHKNFIFSLLFILIVYFFTETMVSFTLWMHKGLYLSLGLFSGYYFNKNKKNFKLKENITE